MPIFDILFSPRGRITRKEFIIGNLIIFAAIGLLGFFLPVSAMIAGLFFLYSMYILGIKRLRDTGHSPWLIIVYVVPALIPLMMIFLAIYDRRR